MANKYSSEKKTVGQILSTTSPNITVPEWQRSFSWTLKEVELFWQDLLSFSGQYPGDTIRDQEYFLGSVVFVDGGNTLELLDGQQRLATSTILLSVIREYVRKYKNDAAERVSQKYIMDFDDSSGTTSFKLALNVYDRDFFRREVQERQEAGQARTDATMESHRLIRQAREFLERKFAEQYASLGDGKRGFDWALRMQRVLTDHVSVVAVSSKDEDNAASVFETLNDRGIGLSTPDLLRNLLLRRAAEAEREEIVQCWRTILAVEENASLDDFLRHYWLSHRGDVKARSLYREIKSKVQNENIGSLEFTRDLQQTARLYDDITSGRDDDPDLQRLLQDVRQLGAKSLYPAILSAFSAGGVEQRRDFVEALLTLFVRHNVIANLENSELESLVFELAKELRAKKDFVASRERIMSIIPDDGTFTARFQTAQVTRSATARYVLREVEHYIRRTRELKVAEVDRVNLEHIYPLRPPDANRWPNHDNYASRIGNLTLLSTRLNQEVASAGFDVKKPYYQGSDLLITQGLVKFAAWSPNEIEERQKDFAKLAAKIWPLP